MNQPEQFKSVGYAYPTSSMATMLGFGKTGCWFVRIGANPDSDLVPGEVVGTFTTQADAQTHAQELDLPFYADRERTTCEKCGQQFRASCEGESLCGLCSEIA